MLAATVCKSEAPAPFRARLIFSMTCKLEMNKNALILLYNFFFTTRSSCINAAVSYIVKVVQHQMRHQHSSFMLRSTYCFPFLFCSIKYSLKLLFPHRTAYFDSTLSHFCLLCLLLWKQPFRTKPWPYEENLKTFKVWSFRNAQTHCRH